MSNSKTTQLGKYESLVNADADCINLIDGIHRRHDQACGVIGLLCSIDLSKTDCLPDIAVSHAAFGLQDTLSEMRTLIDMLYELAHSQDKLEAA